MVNEEYQLVKASSFKRAKKNPGDENWAPEEIDQRQKKSSEMYRHAELEAGPEKEKFAQVIELIKQDLVAVYQRAGVEISITDFPEVQLIDAKKVPQSSAESSNRLKGDFGYFSGVLRFFVNEDDVFLEDIGDLYHELQHAVGKRIVVAAKDRTGKNSLRLGKMGYLTEVNRSENDSGAEGKFRGQVLEEGLAEYLSRDFALNSTSELVAAAREKYLKFVKENYWSAKFNQAILDMNLSDEAICSLGMEQASTLVYRGAREIIANILVKAVGESKEKMTAVLNLLVLARVDSQKRRSLMQEIDDLFGKKIGRRLLIANFTEESVALLLEEMKRQY